MRLIHSQRASRCKPQISSNKVMIPSRVEHSGLLCTALAMDNLSTPHSDPSTMCHHWVNEISWAIWHSPPIFLVHFHCHALASGRKSTPLETSSPKPTDYPSGHIAQNYSWSLPTPISMYANICAQLQSKLSIRDSLVDGLVKARVHFETMTNR